MTKGYVRNGYRFDNPQKHRGREKDIEKSNLERRIKVQAGINKQK